MGKVTFLFFLVANLLQFSFFNTLDAVDDIEKKGEYLAYSHDSNVKITFIQDPPTEVDFRRSNLHFGVCATYNSYPLLNATIFVLLLKDGGNGRHTGNMNAEVELNDNGQGGDVIKGDGCYFGILESCLNLGSYSVRTEVRVAATSCVLKRDEKLYVPSVNGGKQYVPYCATVFPETRKFESGKIIITACKKKLFGNDVSDLKMEIDKNTRAAKLTWTDSWEENTVSKLSLCYKTHTNTAGGWREFEVKANLGVRPKNTKRSITTNFSHVMAKHFIVALRAEDDYGNYKYSNELIFDDGKVVTG